MRVYDQGDCVRVTVSEREVYNFKRHWPCSGLPDRGISFTFDKRNGDLIDFAPIEYQGEDIRVLSYDAQNYAAKRLGIESLRR